MLSQKRIGKFTSSTIFNLMKKGRGNNPSVATQTYIQEKIYESRLGKSLNTAMSSRPTTWGTIVEKYVAAQLDPFEYEYCSDETIEHKTIDTWAGTPDFLCNDRVADVKCPYTLKAFCELADIAIANDLEVFKKNKPEYYWQLVSNSILTERNNAELVAFCPYLSELAAIQEICENEDILDQTKLAWIGLGMAEDLPHLIEGRYYKNLYKFVFEVPSEDKAALTEAVKVASVSLKG